MAMRVIPRADPVCAIFDHFPDDFAGAESAFCVYLFIELFPMLVVVKKVFGV